MLRITQNALDSMLQQSKGCPTETGGALLGAQAASLVYFAGEPGPRAEQHLARFTTDPEQDRASLALCREMTGRQLQLLGYWHKHPQGMPYPSTGDLRQGYAILQAWQQIGEDDPQLIVIILQDEENPSDAIHPFRLTLSMGDFDAILFEVLDNNDPQVQQALHNEPVYLSSKQLEHPWSDMQFSFQHTPAGLARLKNDEHALQGAGWQVALRQSRQDGHVLMELEKDETNLLLRLPPEYPISPPTVLTLPDGQELWSGCSGLPWNSDRSLSAWLTALDPVHQITPDRKTSSRISLYFYFGLLCFFFLTLSFLIGWWTGRLGR